ncbi:MAG: xanthine dehydrogenase family protein molybdopterin-binding subunit [Candidatus Obscuribacterales bacterium]|nr:xanthine dehydrogenase family protein molybdopterin-binding subunit [Candidatus Obscuribacterales bacterium]
MSNEFIGKGLSRLEGPLKVTGKARYSAEFPLKGICYAVLVGSAISAGRVRSINTSKAEKTAGVIKIITHENRPPLSSPGDRLSGSANSEKRLPLQDAEINYAGQYIALVIAETLQSAQHAAELIEVNYDKQPTVLGLKNKNIDRFPAKSQMGEIAKSRGDAKAEYGKAEVKLESKYTTEAQNHNQMEPHASTAIWDGDKLTVYDASQYPAGVRNGLAKMFNIPLENVRVVSHFVGGGFGGKGNMWQHVPLAALAARVARRPVKIVLSRKQMFNNVGNRSETEQRIAIGANKDGTLKAIIHEGVSDTAMKDDFVEQFTISTPMLYACPNVDVAQELVRVNKILPTYMRAPGEATGVWVIESALDELAHAINMDPIELRMKNYAHQDPEKERPFSSKALDKCYQIGAEKFGWSKRYKSPGTNKRGGKLIGLGMATATRGAKRFGAKASARLNADGSFLFRSSTPEQGTGSITVMTQIGADCMGVPLNKVTFEHGDTNFAAAPVAAGSATVSSVGNAVWGAGKAIQKELAEKLIAEKKSPFFGASKDQIEFKDGAITCSAKTKSKLDYASALKVLGQKSLDAKFDTDPFEKGQDHSTHGFGAHFAEVEVDPDLAIVSVKRFLSAVTCGRVMNEKTCKAQVQGGVIWGISQALMESTIFDERSGRVLNRGLDEYHIPVNADIPEIEVHLVPEEEKHLGALGAKGVGEIGIAGVPAAIANAIFNATGKRIRRLPIRIEDILLS